jgi:acyl-coenzyme A synthetase/AMP-(fatty) acid ligase
VTAADLTSSPHPFLASDLVSRYQQEGCWSGESLAETVRRWSQMRPDALAVTGPHTLTYAELDRAAGRLAAYLEKAGIGPGEVLIAALRNGWEAIAVAVGATVLGHALLPLSPAVAPSVAGHLARLAGSRVFIVASELAGDPEWREVWGGAVDPIVLVAGTGPSSLGEVLSAGPGTGPTHRDGIEPALILSTSGTTGVPKGVVHCENAVTYAASGYARAVHLGPDDVWVSFHPVGSSMNSVFAVYSPLLTGGAILPVAGFEAGATAALIEEWGGTFALTVATHLQDWLALDAPNRARLRTVTRVTSAAGPVHLYEQAERELGIKVVRIYGQSECIGHAMSDIDDPAELRLETDGRPFDGTEVQAQGGDGQYTVRGPSLFLGYLANQPDASPLVLDGGFFATGDLVEQRSDGYIRWAGRSTDLIPRATGSVNSITLENVLARHPSVREIVVVGAPTVSTDEGGDPEIVAVCSATRTHWPPQRDTLNAYLHAQGIDVDVGLDRVVVMADLPRTETGKLHRASIRSSVVETARS